MSDLTSDEAVAECKRIIKRHGKEAAYRVVDRILTYGYDADMLAELVDDECQVFRLYLHEKTDAQDVMMAEDVFRLALIREGKRIFMGLDMVGGSA